MKLFEPIDSGVWLTIHGDRVLGDRPPVPAVARLGMRGRLRRFRGQRVLLRAWRESDLEPFAALNGDPVEMEHFPCDDHAGEVERTRRGSEILPMFAEHGFGWWAVEVPRRQLPFIGFVGLQEPRFEARFTPCVEIGWRLAREHWGRGYATEAARLALAYGFDDAGLDEIVSFTVPANRRSVAVMERLGMRYDGEFEHRRLPEGHRLRTHVLYRLARP